MNKYTEKRKRKRHRIKEFLTDYKKRKGCKYCSEKDALCLTFHHRENNKAFWLGAGSNVSWKKVKEEVKKCEVVCENCHKKINVYGEKYMKKKLLIKDIVWFVALYVGIILLNILLIYKIGG